MPADDLSLQPDYAFEEIEKYDTIVTEFENGVEQRRPRWATSLKSWVFVYKNKNSTDVGTLQTLFSTKKGMYDTWYWTNPVNNTQYLVRFNTDELRVSLKAYGVYDVEFSVRQVK